MSSHFKEDSGVLELKVELNDDLLEFDEIVKHENLQEDIQRDLQPQDLNVITVESDINTSGDNKLVEKSKTVMSKTVKPKTVRSRKKKSEITPGQETIAKRETFVAELALAKSIPGKGSDTNPYERKRLKILYCAVPGCKAKFLLNLGVKISSHRIPKEESKIASARQYWIYALGFNTAEELKVRGDKFAKVCDLHFTQDCFTPRDKAKKKTLIPGKYPTLNIAVPDKINRDPQYLNFSNVSSGEDQVSHQTPLRQDANEMCVQQQQTQSLDLIAQEVVVEDSTPRLVHRSEIQYEEMMSQLCSVSPTDFLRSPIVSVAKKERLHFKTSYSKNQMFELLQNSSPGYASHRLNYGNNGSTLVCLPTGAILPDTNVGMLQKTNFKRRLQNLIKTSGVKLSFYQLDIIFDSIPLLNIIDYEIILSRLKTPIKVSKNKVFDVKLSKNVEGQLWPLRPEGRPILIKCQVSDAVSTPTFQPLTIERLRQTSTSNQSPESGVKEFRAKVRIGDVKPSNDTAINASVATSNTNFFNDDRINKLLENLSSNNIDQKDEREILLIQKRAPSATTLSSNGEAKIDFANSPAVNQISKNCLSSSAAAALVTPKCSGINLVSRGGTIIRPFKMSKLESSQSTSATMTSADSTPPLNTSRESLSPTKSGLFKVKPKSTSHITNPDKRREAIFKKLSVPAFNVTRASMDHDYIKASIPWKTEALNRDEALFLLTEVEKWREEVEVLTKKNHELRQNQLQREMKDGVENLKETKKFEKKCECKEQQRLSNLLNEKQVESKQDKKKIAKLEMSNKKLQDQLFLLRLDRRKMKIKERTRRYKRAKVVERRNRRRAWVHKQIELGKMDRSHLCWVYTNKRLPCDLPIKAKKSGAQLEVESYGDELVNTMPSTSTAPNVENSTTTTTVVPKKRKSSRLAATKAKNPRNAPESEDVDITSISSPNGLHFVQNHSSIIVTSYNEAEIAGISGPSDAISGMHSEVIEYQDHMDFIVKAVQEQVLKYLRMFFRSCVPTCCCQSLYLEFLLKIRLELLPRKTAVR